MNKQNDYENKKKSMWTMIFILLGLFIFSLIIASTIGSEEDSNYNTAIIPIKGVITTSESSSFFGSDAVSSSDVIMNIEKAKNDQRVKAIIFEIDSPGGSPVATDEISIAIKDLKNHNITTVAWIRETGASGGYWIASSTDHIVANRMSIVGSIGVYASYLELHGLLNKYNVSYKRLVAGEYKDSGTPLKPLSSAEESMIQERLDLIHEEFIKEVANNRNMTYDDVKKLSNGQIFLGLEGKDNGLVDELGGISESIKFIEDNNNDFIVKTKKFEKDKTFIESLMEVSNKNSFYIGQGIASRFLAENNNLKITT